VVEENKVVLQSRCRYYGLVEVLGEGEDEEEVTMTSTAKQWEGLVMPSSTYCISGGGSRWVVALLEVVRDWQMLESFGLLKRPGDEEERVVVAEEEQEGVAVEEKS